MQTTRQDESCEYLAARRIESGEIEISRGVKEARLQR